MKISIIQLNPVLGDFKRNAAEIIRVAQAAHARGAAAVLLPGMALSGAPLEGLGAREDFQRAQAAAIRRVGRQLPRGLLVVSTMLVDAEEALLEWGALPEGVGVDALLLPAARRFAVGGYARRIAEIKQTARQLKKPVLQANLVGGQDACVFDGGALGAQPDGRVFAGARFVEGVVDVEISAAGKIRSAAKPPKPWRRHEEIWAALTLGVRDYVEKNHLPGVLVALSGGMDSALVATIAVDALGAKRVLGVTLPSRYSAAATHRDALQLAKNLRVECLDIPIEPAVEVFTQMLAAPKACAKSFPVAAGNLAAENLQARIRGVLAMALANRHGLLMLETGNKSESLTGYCTLYGDTCGGFAPLADLYKTDVFALARWRNKAKPVIPPSIIRRAPSAELREGQLDSDSLPPYPELDAALAVLLAGDATPAGVAPETRRRVMQLMMGSEFKRRQTAPGILLEAGEVHRLPVTHAFRG